MTYYSVITKPLHQIIVIAGIFLAMTGSALSESTKMETSLLNAVSRGDLAAVTQALEAGVEVDARNSRGETALLIATHNNNIEAARVLIEAGADVNAKDNIHDSPYLYAGARGHLEILKMTLANGADLRSVNRYGGT